MRRFNEAYRLLAEHLGEASQTAPQRPAAAAPRARLTQDEIDALVRAIDPQGPFDWLLNGVGWIGSTMSAIWGGVFLVVCTIRVAHLLSKQQFAAILKDPHLLIFLAVLLYVVLREIQERRKMAAWMPPNDQMQRTAPAQAMERRR